MIKLKSQGSLDKLTISDQPQEVYDWKQFQQISEIIGFCVFNQCNRWKEFICNLLRDKVSAEDMDIFMDQLKKKMLEYCQLTNVWPCMKYFLWFESNRMPNAESQEKLFKRFWTTVLYFMCVEHEFVNFVEYTSIFTVDQTVEFISVDQWKNGAGDADFFMYKKLLYTMIDISECFLEYYQKVFTSLVPSENQLHQFGSIKNIYNKKLLTMKGFRETQEE